MAARGRRMMSNEERVSIDEKKRQGMSVQEIAKLFRRSSKTISNALKEIGAMNAAVPLADTTPPAPMEARRGAAQPVQSQPALPPPTAAQHRLQQAMPLAVHDSLCGSIQELPPAQLNAMSAMSAPVPSAAGTIKKAEARRSAARAIQPRHAQTKSQDLPPSLQQPLPLHVSVDADDRRSFKLAAPPAPSDTSVTAAAGVQGVTKLIAEAYQPQSAQKTPPSLPPPKQTSSVPPVQLPQQSVAALVSVGTRGERSNLTSTALTIPKPTNGASAATPAVATPGVPAASSLGTLIGRRPIARPPRVLALTRPASMQNETKGSACGSSQDQGATAKSAAAKSNATSTQRVGANAETLAPPDPDLTSLLLGMAPDDDTSPQTSQEDETASSHVGNLSQASNVSSKGDASICLSQVSLPQQSSRASTAAPHGKPHCDDGTKTRQDIETKKRSLRLVLASLQDQVNTLQPEHIGDDTSTMYQLLSRFRDELGVLNLDATPRCSERKRKRDEDADSMVLGKLLHEKVAAEVALVSIQVQRERVQLDRERMKTKVGAALSRKKLEDASIPKSTIDSIFAQMTAN